MKKKRNVFMVLSGHIPGIARRDDLEERVVYQLLSDYQNFPMDGSGYLRIMTFEPWSDKIRVTSFFPYLDEYLADSGNHFDLLFDVTGGTPPVGNTLVYGGFYYCISPAEDGSCELGAVDDNSLRAVYLGDFGHKGSLLPAISISSLQRSE